MASTTYLRKSGLVVAEESVDESRLQHALEQIDDRLILTKEIDRKHQTWVWKVHVVWASDKPAWYVCDWRDLNGQPLPLSSGLVERVREQLALRDEPGHGLDLADRLNAERQADLDRQIHEAEMEAARLVARFGSAGHSSLLTRGVHLRRSRARVAEAENARKRVFGR